MAVVPEEKARGKARRLIERHGIGGGRGRRRHGERPLSWSRVVNQWRGAEL
ncbi:MAG: hypothetical protein JO010_14625 [Alphaproteobacteria bacterium]|nr:hypothetical protein [Alphaproteobacteria bacterium]